MTDQSPNLTASDVDRLGQALLTLASELWAVKDRLRVLEAVLEEAGLVPPDAVDEFPPGDTLNSEMESQRQRLIQQLLDTLAPTIDT